MIADKETPMTLQACERCGTGPCPFYKFALVEQLRAEPGDYHLFTLEDNISRYRGSFIDADKAGKVGKQIRRFDKAVDDAVVRYIDLRR